MVKVLKLRRARALFWSLQRKENLLEQCYLTAQGQEQNSNLCLQMFKDKWKAFRKRVKDAKATGTEKSSLKRLLEEKNEDRAARLHLAPQAQEALGKSCPSQSLQSS